MNWLLNSNNEKMKSMGCHLQSAEREWMPHEKSALQENTLHGGKRSKTKTPSEMEKNEGLPHQQNSTKEIQSSSDRRKIQPRCKPNEKQPK